MRFPALQCLVVLILSGVDSQYYDSFTGDEINRTRYEEIERIGLTPVCAIRVNECDAHAPRRMDLSCNSLRYPSRGTSFTPFVRMLPPVFSEGGGLRRSKSGQPLPLARPLRVALMTDGRRPHARYTQMLSNFNVFIASETTSVHDTVNYVALTRTCCQPGGELNPQCMPVEVLDDDLHLRRSNVRCMNLTRAITYQDLGCVPDDVPRERINLAAPMLELSSVYGNDEVAARRGREFKWGRMRAETINGKEWPPSGGQVCLNNVPPRETRCHDVPTPGTNALLGINLVFMWFYRSHNSIAAALRNTNPCWDDNKLYYTAREINIAYFSQITYYEMMPELTGWEFLVQNKVVFETEGHVDDYDPHLEPRLSIEHSTATRWFHTIQDGTLNLYKPDGRMYGSVQVMDFILRTGALPLDGNIEGMTQGSFRQPGADTDQLVDPDVGERILGRLQLASDVISSDILKGRDFGLPPYNEYRKACGLPRAEKFKDLLGWMDRQQVEAMASFYEHPDDIDLIAALLAEKRMPGAALAPTLACIMSEQMARWRRADRFWFEHTGHPAALTLQQLREIRKMTFAKLVCQHGDSVTAIQPRAFLLPGDGNEITKCSEYDMPDLSVFRDARCYPHPTPRNEEYLHPTPSNEEYLYPTPRNEEYLHPIPRPKEHTTLRDYLAQIFDTNQYKPLISYPNNDLTILTNPNRNGDPTSSKQGYNDDPTKVLKTYDESTILTNHDDPILSKHGYNNDPTSSKLGYNYDPTNIIEPNVDPTLLSRRGDPASSVHGYIHDPTSSKLGYNDDPTKLVIFNIDPTSTNDGDSNSKKFNSLFPNRDPNVKIYPNADPIDLNHKIPKVNIPSYSNSNSELLNSKSGNQNLKYLNIHPSVRNQQFPFEEFLQNYWQSSNANPFKAAGK